MKILADEIPARPKGYDDVCSVTQCAFPICKYCKQCSFTASTALNWDFLIIEIEFK